MSWSCMFSEWRWEAIVRFADIGGFLTISFNFLIIINVEFYPIVHKWRVQQYIYKLDLQQQFIYKLDLQQ
jgi:hypothetical protein